ncbi:hypothetical protein M413DRAFT_448397 [Hebeloma cylindrosporum]|uniref:Ubiquitin-like domain-containing protein n=1 Tax=Hebeloma cylindrosporum TaxID=76867 RepID=A0A0C2Y9B1_HEBCY|nr:hypothetical protein M413DRAFT_448397 [Hebeloma cylindrosporum h7]
MADTISLKIFVAGQEGGTTISASPSSTMRQVAQTFFGQPENVVQPYQFSTNGRRIDSSLTLEQSGFTGGEEIHCVKLPKARKPVIYLLSPQTIEASVTLSLIPTWKFSSIYPIVPIHRSPQDSKEEITWRVQVHPGGELTELITGLKVAYLFWEAQSEHITPISPPPSPVLSAPEEDMYRHEIFNPTEASLDDRNSILIPIQQITTYLDKTLKHLGLHTEARTSFITYWLPFMLRHENIALRFVPQWSFEKSAPLTVEPSPDVVTRVFMIFQGVPNKDLNKWPVASSTPKDWPKLIGVDLARASNTNLFRVLEWGGMEVTPVS